MKKYMCLICGHIYDEAFGDPDTGIPAPGTKWEDVPSQLDVSRIVARARKTTKSSSSDRRAVLAGPDVALITN